MMRKERSRVGSNMGRGGHLTRGNAVFLQWKCCNVSHSIHIRVAGAQVTIHLPRIHPVYIPMIVPDSQNINSCRQVFICLP